MLKYYEPIKGLNVDGEETVCCLVISITTEDAVMVERARRDSLGRKEKLSEEDLLDEFMVHNWAWLEKQQQSTEL